MQTDTQKNWNKLFKNEKEQRYKCNPIIIIILIICLSSIIIYYFKNKDNITKDNDNVTNVINLVSNKISAGSKTIIPNKNGYIMANSLEIVKNIFENINFKTIDELYKDKESLENIDLSNDYTQFENDINNKISSYIKYKETLQIEYMNQYNDINYIDTLAKIFDKIKIKYNIENNSILYTYYK